MNKEEILAKSRNEKKDEGMAIAENRGRKIGISAFCIVFIVIAIVNLFNGQPNDAPMAMFWAFFAADALPKYKFTKNKAYLITVIAGFLASFAFLATFILKIVVGV